MWYILWKSIITVLVIYALINIFQKTISAIFCREPYKNENVFIVIKVKNQEKKLEGVIRSIIWKNLNVSRGGYIPNILIVDTGSEDSTPIIAEKLSKDYSFIFFVTEDRFEKMKDYFL